MTSTPGESVDAKHREQMQELQAEMHAKIAAAREKRDLLIVHTGDGKGKSTAGFGLLARMLGHKRPCAVIQFVKKGDRAVERALARPLLHWHSVGDGFTWDSQDRSGDIASCRKGLALAVGYLRDPEIGLVLLDELNIALAYNYLPLDEVLAAWRDHAPGKHLVITGRGAPAGLIEAADLVTEMRATKHPFAAGVQAQAGIEF